MNSHKAYRCCSRVTGFTLPELMVSLTLGLFLIGGALTVFVSNRQIMLDKTAIDAAQEASRFGWFALSRIVRLGTRVGDASNDGQLVVNYPRRPDILDCLGNPVNDGTATNKTDTFWLQGNQLVCNGADNPIVGGVTSFSVTYGVPSADDWIRSADFQAAADVNMADVRSVRIELTTDAGKVAFVATLRQRILEDLGNGG
jgi:type II secretory pathway pseudopilin PulG